MIGCSPAREAEAVHGHAMLVLVLTARFLEGWDGVNAASSSARLACSRCELSDQFDCAELGDQSATGKRTCWRGRRREEGRRKEVLPWESCALGSDGLERCVLDEQRDRERESLTRKVNGASRLGCRIGERVMAGGFHAGGSTRATSYHAADAETCMHCTALRTRTRTQH